MKKKKWIWIVLLGVFVAVMIGASEISSVDTPEPTHAPTQVIETFKVQFTGALILDANSNGFAETGEGVAGEQVYVAIEGITFADTIVTTDANGMFETDVLEVTQVQGKEMVHGLAVPQLESCSLELHLNIYEQDGVRIYNFEVLLDNNCQLLEGEVIG